jgi:hypothetical protein
MNPSDKETMQATAILKDFSSLFYDGDTERPDVFPGFLHQSPAEQWKKVQSLKADGRVSVRIGHANAFRDQVELNQLVRGPHSIACKVEPRRGYKLATFTFSKA